MNNGLGGDQILKLLVPATDCPTGGCTLPNLVTLAITWIFWVAGIMAFIYLVYSGILYLTAAGNPDAAKKGQQGIINAIIGVIVIILAYVILRSLSVTVSTSTN
jgi:hypothetical protein